MALLEENMGIDLLPEFGSGFLKYKNKSIRNKRKN